MRIERALAAVIGSSTIAACGPPLERLGASQPVREVVAANSPDDVFGRTIEVHTERYAYVGELLACDREAIYLRIHMREPDAYRRIEWRSIVSSHVSIGAWGPGALVWSFLGTAASLGTGIMFIGFGPAWALTGTIVTALEWGRGENSRDCEAISRYARFPQGIPPGWRSESGMSSPEPVALPVIEIGAASPPSDPLPAIPVSTPPASTVP